MTTLSLPLPNLIGGVSQQPKALRPLTAMETDVNNYADIANGLNRRPPLEFVASLDSATGTAQLVHPIVRDDDEKYVVWIGDDTIKVFDLDGIEYPVHSDDAAASYEPDFNYLKVQSENPLNEEEDPAVEDDIELLDWAGAWTVISGTATFTHTEIDSLGTDDYPGPYNEDKIAEIDGDNTGSGSAENSAIWLEATTIPWTLNLKYVFSCFFKQHDTGTPFTDIRLGFLKGTGFPETDAWAKFVWIGSELQLDSVYAPDSSQLSGGVEDVGGGWYRAYVVYDANDSGASSWTTYFSGNNVTPEVILTMDASTQHTDYAFGPHLTVTDAASPEPLPYYEDSIIRATSVADYTFVVNNATEAAMDTDTSSELSGTHAIVYVKEAAYGKNYGIELSIGGTTYTRSVSTNSSFVSGGGGAPNANTDEIANYLDQSFTPSLPGTTTVTRDGSVIHFEDSTADIEWVKVKDGSGDGFISGFTDEVRSVDDLPTICIHGYKVKVQGDPGIGEDDYWLEFEGEESSGLTTGFWKESVAPGITTTLKADTLPHTLVRMQDDISGTVTGVPYQIYFEWGPADWSTRDVGDAETNPDPSFIGQRISDVFFYRNRLGLLSGDNVVLTGSGDFFNFWRTTVQVLPDDDPIDIAVTGTDVADLQAAVEFNGDLLLFDRDKQYRLFSNETLTPSTVETAAVLHHEYAPEAKPVPNGRTLFMVGPQGDNLSVRELYDQGNGSYLSPDLTAALPTFISGTLKAAAASRTEDVLAILTSNDDTLYIHNYFWQGQEKVHSSWRTWTLPNGVTAEGLAALDGYLYLVTQDAGGTYLERFELGVEKLDSSGEERILLDRILPDTAVTLLYNSGAGDTSVFLPYYVPFGDTMKVVIRDPGYGAQSHGEEYTDAGTLTGNGLDFVTFSVLGSHTALENFYIGIPYESELTLTEPAITEETRRGTDRRSAGDLRVHRLLVDYDDTEEFDVEVTPVEGSGTLTTSLEDGTEGTLDVPVRSKARGLAAKLTKDGWFNWKLQRAEWIAAFTARSQRYRG